MKTFLKLTTASLFALIAFLAVPTVVMADGPATPSATPRATATPKPTSTPAPETRVECTTGAYGQQTCKTVIVERQASPEGKPKHDVVDSGLQEDVMMAILGLFAFSTFAYVHSTK